MTERIVEMMYRINENIENINLHLSRMDKMMNKMINEENEICEVGEWILENTCIDNPDYDKVTVVMYCDTQRYKCCGNAVTTNVITYIFNNWDLKEDDD